MFDTDLGYFINDVDDDGYYPGERPRVVVIKDTLDPHMWARRQASKDLGIPEEELADEPDEMSDHSDQQGYDMEAQE